MPQQSQILAGLFSLWLGLSTLGATSADADASTRVPAPRAVDHALFAGPDGKPLPFAGDEQLLAFLATATVVSEIEIQEGINRPRRLLLEKEGVRMHAIFRTVDKQARRYRTHDRLVLNFHDFHGYEVAAYRLSRLLGISSVPPAVLRTIGDRQGSLQLWIESAKTERQRREAEGRPPRSLEWARQWQSMRVFDALIDNFDRNLGNILIDPAWKVWLVDHTRSFTIHRHAFRSDRIRQCRRSLWRRLRSLEEATLFELLGDLLDKTQIRAIMKRCGLVIRHLEKLIEQRGEAAVLAEQADAPANLERR